jgi:hypothetical protein
LAAFRAAADEANHALRGEEIIVGGQTLTAAITLGSAQVENREGGLVRVRTLAATIRKTILSTRPTEKTKIVYAGQAFAVTEVRGDEVDAPSWFVRAMAG